MSNMASSDTLAQLFPAQTALQAIRTRCEAGAGSDATTCGELFLHGGQRITHHASAASNEVLVRNLLGFGAAIILHVFSCH